MPIFTLVRAQLPVPCDSRQPPTNINWKLLRRFLFFCVSISPMKMKFFFPFYMKQQIPFNSTNRHRTRIKYILRATRGNRWFHFDSNAKRFANNRRFQLVRLIKLCGKTACCYSLTRKLFPSLNLPGKFLVGISYFRGITNLSVERELKIVPIQWSLK